MGSKLTVVTSTVASKATVASAVASTASAVASTASAMPSVSTSAHLLVEILPVILRVKGATLTLARAS